MPSTSEVKTFSSSFFSATLDFLYPPQCVLCGMLGEAPICPACDAKFRPSEQGVRTRHEGGPLDFKAYLYAYEGRAAQAVRRLKYARASLLVHEMAERMLCGYEKLGLQGANLIVPIPIHWTRLAARGFNQARLLCDSLPKAPVRLDALHRIRATRPQAGLDKEARQQNLLGAFRATEKVSGKQVLLIDDVFTSGHTAVECARACKEAGAREVGILTFCGTA